MLPTFISAISRDGSPHYRSPAIRSSPERPADQVERESRLEDLKKRLRSRYKSVRVCCVCGGPYRPYGVLLCYPHATIRRRIHSHETHERPPHKRGGHPKTTISPYSEVSSGGGKRDRIPDMIPSPHFVEVGDPLSPHSRRAVSLPSPQKPLSK